MSLSDSAPSKRQAEAIKLAIGSANAKHDDKDRAMAIWNDLRWKIQTDKPADWMALEAILAAFTDRVMDEIKTPLIRDAVLARLSEMRNRLSEFNVEPPNL